MFRFLCALLIAGSPVWAEDAPLIAEEQVVTGKFLTALEVRPILSATKANWVALRDWEGQDLLYVTHLFAWRCGLVQMKVGVNDNAPEVWALPDCHPETAFPNALLPEDGLPYRAFGKGEVETITVEITYDDLTTDTASFERGAVMLP